MGKLIYGPEHPYSTYLTEQNVNAITRDGLVHFHALHFSPDNATLAIVGDLTADGVMPIIEKRSPTGPSRPARTRAPRSFPTCPAAQGARRASRGPPWQRAIGGHRVPARRHAQQPRRARVGVLNSILGGGFSGRLFQNLRERHGYTYGSSSSFAMNLTSGTFEATAEVRNAVTLPAIQEILNELRRLDDEKVPDPEVEMQREFLTGNYLLSLESASRTASRVQEIDLYKLPVDYYKNYASRVSGVSADRIKALADKYLGNPDKGGWIVVVVGEAKEVRAQLETLGPVTVYDTDLKVKAP